MVGKAEGEFRMNLGTRSFWTDKGLNGLPCEKVITVWAERHGRGEPFYSMNEARGGDIVAFGTGWHDVVFGIYLDGGKFASASHRLGCGGVREKDIKLILVRSGLLGKPFIGGVHIGRR